MSIQFAKNETLIRKFDYSTLGYRKKTDSYAVSRSLIVTNKRVIHQDVSEQAGRDLIIRREMPIEHAKFIDIRYAKRSKIGRLIAALILAILAVATYFLTSLKTALPDVKFIQKLPDFLFWIVAGFFGLIALISLIKYFTNRNIYLAFEVSTDSEIRTVFANTLTNETHNSKKAKKNTLSMEVDVNINKKAAKELADGLGAAILDAIEMNRETERAAAAIAPAPTPVVVEIPPITCSVNLPTTTPIAPAEEPVETSNEEIVDEKETVEETVTEEVLEEVTEEVVEEAATEEIVEEVAETETPEEEVSEETVVAEESAEEKAELL